MKCVKTVSTIHGDGYEFTFYKSAVTADGGTVEVEDSKVTYLLSELEAKKTALQGEIALIQAMLDLAAQTE